METTVVAPYFREATPTDIPFVCAFMRNLKDMYDFDKLISYGDSGKTHLLTTPQVTRTLHATPVWSSHMALPKPTSASLAKPSAKSGVKGCCNWSSDSEEEEKPQKRTRQGRTPRNSYAVFFMSGFFCDWARRFVFM